MILEALINMNRRKGSPPFQWTEVFTEHDPKLLRSGWKSPKEIWSRLVAGAKARGLMPKKAKR